MVKPYTRHWVTFLCGKPVFVGRLRKSKHRLVLPHVSRHCSSSLSAESWTKLRFLDWNLCPGLRIWDSKQGPSGVVIKQESMRSLIYAARWDTAQWIHVHVLRSHESPIIRENKKWKFSFFHQRHAWSMSFHIFIVTYRVTNCLPKLVHMLLFSMENFFFFFFSIPFFGTALESHDFAVFIQVCWVQL